MRHLRGFTLVELAIVMVIIGLVAGGVLVGRELIRAATLQQMARQLEQYNTAIAAFRIKYGAIPGDMDKATNFWPAVSNGCTSQQGTGEETCNGNGNGQVGDVLNGSENYEIFRLWQHLANAGYITEPMTGVAGPNNHRNAIAGENVPTIVSRKDVGFSVLTVDQATVDTYSSYYFSTLAGTSLTVGTEHPGLEDYELLGEWLTGKDIYSIDVKIDNGQAGTGRVFGSPNSSSFANQCTTTNIAQTAVYNMADDVVRCHLNYKLRI